MKFWWLLLLLPLFALANDEPVTPLTASKYQDHVPLIVQPYYVKDIYRNQIMDNIPFHITVVTFRNFDNDVWKESKRYAINRTYKRANPHNKRPIITLGDKQEFGGQFFGNFRDKDCLCYILGDITVNDDHHPIRKAVHLMEATTIYVVSDDSDLARYREEALRASMKEVGVNVVVAKIGTVTDLRATIVKWNSLSRGLLFINAFDIGADSGARVGYRYIEYVITDFNKKHLEVGVYRNQHRSALAVGLDPKDIGEAIVHTVQGTKPTREIKVKSSVNVQRLGQLHMLHMAAGSFKEAFLYEPIDSR